MQFKKVFLISVLNVLLSPLSTHAMDKDILPFQRTDAIPDVSEDEEFVNFDIHKLEPKDEEQFKKIMVLLDEIIGETAQEYAAVRESFVFKFSTALSKKYLQLLEAYVKMQIALHIPPIRRSEVGRLKGIALSHQEILQLEKLANDINFENLVTNIENTSTPKDQNLLWQELFKDHPNINNFPNLQTPLKLFNILTHDQQFLLERAYKFAAFRHMSPVDLIDEIMKLKKIKNIQDFDEKKQHTLISKSIENPKDFKSRLLMEMQHRVIDLNAKEGQSSYGALGSNVLALYNVITKGEPKHPLSEFRNKMYFVYMLNDFVNEILLLPKDEFIKLNSILQEDYKWSLDVDLIEYLKKRRPEVSHVAPLFRYGTYADLNTKGLRRYRTVPSNNPPPSSMPDPKSFSERERIALYGEKKPISKPITIYSGKEAFELTTDPNMISNSNQAVQYLKIVNKLGLPVIAGISGTLDQSLTMARLVGLAMTPQEMKLIRLAYIAFMVPNHDHTVHEILESSKSFGLSYKATPLLHYKVLDSHFASRVKEKMSHKYNIDIDKVIDEVKKQMN